MTGNYAAMGGGINAMISYFRPGFLFSIFTALSGGIEASWAAHIIQNLYAYLAVTSTSSLSYAFYADKISQITTPWAYNLAMVLLEAIVPCTLFYYFFVHQQQASQTPNNTAESDPFCITPLKEEQQSTKNLLQTILPINIRTNTTTAKRETAELSLAI